MHTKTALKQVQKRFNSIQKFHLDWKVRCTKKKRSTSIWKLFNLESIRRRCNLAKSPKRKTLKFKRISSINLNKDIVQFLDNPTFAVGYFGVQQLFPAPKFGRAPQTTKFSQHGGRPASIAFRSLPSKMTDLLCKMKAVAGWAPAPWAGDFLPLVVFPLARHDAAREKTLSYIRVVLF